MICIWSMCMFILLAFLLFQDVPKKKFSLPRGPTRIFARRWPPSSLSGSQTGCFAYSHFDITALLKYFLFYCLIIVGFKIPEHFFIGPRKVSAFLKLPKTNSFLQFSLDSCFQKRDKKRPQTLGKNGLQAISWRGHRWH